MEDNSNNNFSTTYRVVDYTNNKEKKAKNSFSKSVLVPFFSGILGTSLVIGTCFGVPRNTRKTYRRSCYISFCT